MKHILRPDGFALGLFLVGLLLVVMPLMAMSGIIAMLSALAYWLIMA